MKPQYLSRNKIGVLAMKTMYLPRGNAFFNRETFGIWTWTNSIPREQNAGMQHYIKFVFLSAWKLGWNTGNIHNNIRYLGIQHVYFNAFHHDFRAHSVPTELFPWPAGLREWVQIHDARGSPGGWLRRHGLGGRRPDRLVGGSKWGSQ